MYSYGKFKKFSSTIFKLAMVDLVCTTWHCCQRIHWRFSVVHAFLTDGQWSKVLSKFKNCCNINSAIFWQCLKCSCLKSHNWCYWKARWKFIIVYNAEKMLTRMEVNFLAYEQQHLIDSQIITHWQYLVMNSEQASATTRPTHGRAPYVYTCKSGYRLRSCSTQYSNFYL